MHKKLCFLLLFCWASFSAAEDCKEPTLWLKGKEKSRQGSRVVTNEYWVRFQGEVTIHMGSYSDVQVTGLPEETESLKLVYVPSKKTKSKNKKVKGIVLGEEGEKGRTLKDLHFNNFAEKDLWPRPGELSLIYKTKKKSCRYRYNVIGGD